MLPRCWPLMISRACGVFFGDAKWLTPEVRAQYRAVWGHPAGGLQSQVNYYRASPLRPALKADDLINTLVLPTEAVTVHVPTTVLWADDDIALLPSLLHGLQQWVPQLQVQHVPGATHWIVHEQPALVAETVVQVLAQGPVPV